MLQNPLLVLLGPTASGKTKLAARLAAGMNAEVISADSRQVFRGMDIGTGKDLGEYVVDGHMVPHHLINIKEAGEKYNVNEFKDDFYCVFEELTSRKILPILCGGTGMYIHSILQHQPYTAIPVNEVLRNTLIQYNKEDLKSKLAEYPWELTKHADQSSHKRMIRAIEIAEYLRCNELTVEERPVINPFIAGLFSDVVLRREKIIKRLQSRFDEGLIDEVSTLLKNGISKELLEFYGLEYKFVTAHLFGELTFPELKDRLSTAICQYAKRQMTFFRKMEKDGLKIHWFNTDLGIDEINEAITDSFTIHMNRP